jgi:hypothetical protein
MDIINFCKETCRPQETALYAVGGFLSGRCMGIISPMDGAAYMVAIRMAYLVSQKFTNEALDYLERKIFDFDRYLSKTPQKINPNKPSYLNRLKSSGSRLAARWVGFVVRGNLSLLKPPRSFINVYLSYGAGNEALYLLGKQPVGLLAATGIFFSSAVFAVLASSSINLAKAKKAAC